MAKTLSYLIMAIMIVSMIVGFLKDTSLIRIWSFILMLQGIVFLPLLQISLPRNLLTFLNCLRPVAQFEIQPITYFSDFFFFQNQNSSRPHDIQFAKYGINDIEVKHNYGSIFLYMILYIIVFILIFIGMISVKNYK